MMEFEDGWRLLSRPGAPCARRMPLYGWTGLAVVLVAECLLAFRVEPVYTCTTPVMWFGYIAFIDAWTFRRAGRSLLHPSALTSPRGRQLIWIMLPSSVFWWLLFEFINCYLENWHYIGIPDNPSRYAGYIISFATIFPGILCTAEWLLTFEPFQDRVMPETDSGRRVPLTNGFLRGSSILAWIAIAIPMLLPWREARWYLFAPVWVGYIYLVEPVLYRYRAPSLFRAWENRQTRSIAAYLLAGVVCGLLWEFWNFWAGAKWLYTVPFTATVRYFEMPVLGFLGFIPFAWECYALFSLSLLLCGAVKGQTGFSARGRLAALGVVSAVLALCVLTYATQPKRYFRIDHVFTTMPLEGTAPSDWSEPIQAVEEGRETPEILLEMEWRPENHFASDLRTLGQWLRSADAAKRRVANRVLRDRSVAARFAWANSGKRATEGEGNSP